jgi:hypothetical protein
VVDEHRAAEAEVGGMGAAPDSGQWWLAIGRISGGARAVARARGRAEAQANCGVR